MNNRFFIFLPFISFIILSTFVNTNIANNFTLGDEDFLLNGKPFQMISGELHYPRIPRQAWKERIQMAKAMGLNTIGTYVFWNVHEPQKGEYDFSGNSDVAEFLRIAQEEDMWVVLRPSPYVCAEWEYGGYPYWLQNEEGLEVRSMNDKYLSLYTKYINEVGKQISPYLVHRGGNVLMVQVENEYGSYGNDKVYLQKNKDIFINAGFDGILFTCDPEAALENGHLEGLLPTVNGVELPDKAKKLIRKYNKGKGPYYIAEWYPAWFDSWGEIHHTVSGLATSLILSNILRSGISINMYMFHGGSTRGYMNGANYHENLIHKYKPQTSSYDYDAPLDEAGNPTKKYHLFREVIVNHLKATKSERKIPPVPELKPSMSININFSSSLNIYDYIVKSQTQIIKNKTPLTFEKLNQPYGFIMYSNRIQNYKEGLLKINDLRDFAIVFLNKKFIGRLNRMKEEFSIKLPKLNTNQPVVLDIILENLGRINFGSELKYNNKGITSNVMIDNQILLDWNHFLLPFDSCPDFYENYSIVGFENEIDLNTPVVKFGTFSTDVVMDTYLDFTTWGKGVVWINGYNLGRYWHIGPQQTIYVPREWINKGLNEIVVFELLNSTYHKNLEGIKNSILDKLQ